MKRDKTPQPVRISTEAADEVRASKNTLKRGDRPETKSDIGKNKTTANIDDKNNKMRKIHFGKDSQNSDEKSIAFNKQTSNDYAKPNLPNIEVNQQKSFDKKAAREKFAKSTKEAKSYINVSDLQIKEELSPETINMASSSKPAEKDSEVISKSGIDDKASVGGLSGSSMSKSALKSLRTKRFAKAQVEQLSGLITENTNLIKGKP